VATGSPRAQDPVAAVRFRRNADRLTADQLALLREAFEAVYGIDDDRGYAHHAGIHGLPLPIGCDNAHGTPYFLPWHRAYLYFFERALRDRVADAMLTWWDWRTDANRPARVPAPFANARVARKANPLNSARVPRLALDQGRRAGMTVPGRTVREPRRPRAHARRPRGNAEFSSCATFWTSALRWKGYTTACTSGPAATWD
jgi:tyrosinase